jgi:hypothetical protein
MKKLFFVASILLFAIISNAQITFQKLYEGSFQSGISNALSVCQTSDKGYFITGMINSNSFDAPIIKTDSLGSLIWSKRYGDTGFDQADDGLQTADGNFIVTGNTEISSTGGFSYTYLIKLNSNGDSLWTKAYGGFTTYSSLVKVEYTSDGGFILSGCAYGFKIFLIKTDSVGNALWIKTYDTNSLLEPFEVHQTADSGYIVSGTVSGGNNGLYLMKTNLAGDTLWQHTYIVPGSFTYKGGSVVQTNDGGYMLAGLVDSDYVCILKTDTLGILEWAKEYSFSGINSYGYCTLIKTIDGKYAFGGMKGYHGFLLKVDSAGIVDWLKSYRQFTDAATSAVSQTSDGGYILAGYSSAMTVGIFAVYLVKTDGLGNSGCNDSTVYPTIVIPSIQIYSHNINVDSIAISYISPFFVFDTIGIENTLCLSVGVSELNSSNSDFNVSPTLPHPPFILRLTQSKKQNRG